MLPNDEGFPPEFEGEDEDDTPLVILTDQPKFTIRRGKYKGLVLPRVLGTKPDYQDKVIAMKRAIEADPEFKPYASLLAQAYADLRQEQDRIKEELADCNLRLEAVAQMLADQYEIEDTSSVTMSNGDNVRVQPEPKAVVVDRAAFRKWCLDNDFLDSMMLPWQTTNKVTKEYLMAGEKEPDGVIAGVSNKIVYTPAQKKVKP